MPATVAEQLKQSKFISSLSQSDEEKLNRFQSFVAGEATGVSQSQQTIDMLEDTSEVFDVSALLHGPMYGRGNDKAEKKRVMADLTRGYVTGTIHELWMKYQREAAAIDPALSDDVMGVNIVVPKIMIWESAMPTIDYVVIVSDKDDAGRIARRHLKKQPTFTPVFFQSIIATTDNEHWKRQRNHLNEVFLPRQSLAQIFPTSLDRAKLCAARLGQLAAEAGEHGVQMHEFFLHEAQAQLQLALFGMDEEFMESTNKKLRDVFNGTNDDPNYGKDMCLTMMRKVRENPAFASASSPEVLAGEKAVFGPLSKAIADAGDSLNMNIFDQFGNMMVILFAGHDTTAHTMTWFAYEMAKAPELQVRLQAEIDAMFDSLGGRDMTYDDCSMLPFMTRCVMETLRLWTAVPNGTFRELEEEETVKGPGGKPVILPKGTFVQIPNWMRQRNPVLWGPDAEVFNPDRAFKDEEIWHGKAFHGANPSSARFSPFTYAPRECLGKNFAQMEMRTILSQVFRHFTFTLSEPYARHDPARDGPLENIQGTSGPRDITPEGLEECRVRLLRQQRPNMAMYLKVTPRRPVGARL